MINMLIQKVKSVFHPAMFQGWGKKKNYFEGWYFKIIDRESHHAYAFIPGVAMDNSGNKHAFIQVLNGKTKKAEYLKFKYSDFSPDRKRFAVSIGDNYFSAERLQLALADYNGKIYFNNNFPWPNKWYSPGIMGPYTFAPFMECYHGIVSMDHSLSGKLHIHNTSIDFDGGRGYIEKDWGKSFPSAYVWLQSNHFSNPGISLKCSVAKIPWIGSSFTGFIAGLLINGRLFRFTTYNRSVLKKLAIKKDEIRIVMENPVYSLELNINPDFATSLVSPVRGAMEGRIDESMTSRARIKLIEKRTGKMVFNDNTDNLALEVAGNTHEIIL